MQVALRLHRDTETPHQGLRVSVQNVINTFRTGEIKAITVKEQRRGKKPTHLKICASFLQARKRGDSKLDQTKVKP